MNYDQYTDAQIVNGLLRKDERLTKSFLYRQCYPLFKSVFDNYYTDCESCLEFTNEIYRHILMPNKITGTCKLQNFRFESTLMTWLKTVCLFYCYEHYKRRKRTTYNNIQGFNDRFGQLNQSVNIDSNDINRQDVTRILDMMPNNRYREIIRLHYLEHKTNEEVADILDMTMANYYNKHKRAKEQFVEMLRKEGLYA